MRYGKQKETNTLDENGSTVTKETNFVDHKTVNPVRKRYEIRQRVADKKEEMTEYLKFSDSLDGTKLDPEFRLEFPSVPGTYYYVVKCYTELEYNDR